MKIIPVIDILGGKAVHARGGQRSEYRPLVSVLTSHAAEPLKLAKAYRNNLGLKTVYLADLDAIQKNQPDGLLYSQIIDLDIRLWVDAGTQSASQASHLLKTGVDTIILGLESIRSPDQLKQIIHDSDVPKGRFLLSLDQRDGRVLFPENHQWPVDTTITDVMAVALEQGLTRFLMLDLARVGSGLGAAGALTGFEILEKFPEALVWLGGGVSDFSDLIQIAKLPLEGLLMATAIHQGRIGINEIHAFSKLFDHS